MYNLHTTPGHTPRALSPPPRCLHVCVCWYSLCRKEMESTDDATVVHVHNGIFFSHNKKWNCVNWVTQAQNNKCYYMFPLICRCWILIVTYMYLYLCWRECGYRPKKLGAHGGKTSREGSREDNRIHMIWNWKEGYWGWKCTEGSGGQGGAKEEVGESAKTVSTWATIRKPAVSHSNFKIHK